ncbi:MAG: hypothetical protein NC548_53930 [Lachnospiraceae bacterium]|nr:hypothetical protein [Lachnospiraceae bacterium]
MSKIILKPLRSRKQLRKVSFKDVISAGHTDDAERFFTISFDVGNGVKQDLTIAFETRSPRVYISEEYRD